MNASTKTNAGGEQSPRLRATYPARPSHPDCFELLGVDPGDAGQEEDGHDERQLMDELTMQAS